MAKCMQQMDVRILDGVTALLFDLDGTLLGLDIDAFLPVYFQALVRRFDGIMPGHLLLDSVNKATFTMIGDRDRSRCNRDAFWGDFLPRVPLPGDKLEPIFAGFYQEDFPTLRYLARPLPEARALLQRAVDRGYTLVLATNPVFPREAVYERMRWGNIHDIPFALVTTYENMHACKPQLEYYEEILDVLKLAPEQCLMVGNDVQEDLVASLLRIRTYLVEGPYLRDQGEPRYEPYLRGSLDALAALL
ncbi:MAG TPA: HAD family hydrolase [Firmicutes bacterium]|nr:HAD family hydrolase [Bacillota bacterium]